MALSEATKQHRKANNLCPKCGQPNELNKSMCRKHLDQECARSSRNQKRRRLTRGQLGLCTVCGGETTDGKKLCEQHRQYKQAKQKERFIAWKENGLCLDCGGQRMEGVKFCDKCLENTKIRQRRHRKSRADNKICTQCGLNPPAYNGQLCRECLDKHNDWYSTFLPYNFKACFV